MKKYLISFAAAAAVVFNAAAFPVFSAGQYPDMNDDGTIDVFDMISARQDNLSDEQLNTLSDYILGKDISFPKEETQVTTTPPTEKINTTTTTTTTAEKPKTTTTTTEKIKTTTTSATAPEETTTTSENSEYTIDESCILEPKGTVHTGDGTFYGGGYVGGCAMLDPVSTDYWIVAMNLEDYNNAQLAGAYLEVTGELGTINMLVTDLLPEGKKGDLDLYVDAFPLIAPPEKGRVPVSWKIVPLDTAENAPVSYKYKEGSTEFWCGVQVRNHRYPITKLEYLDENGEFQEIKRRQYNYFESDKMGKGPFTFRITDIYGQVVIDENIPLSTDDTEIIQGHVQLPE